MGPILDPRSGDIEDDAASPQAHSMLSLAGSLLVEISLPKLIYASFVLVVAPAILLGVVPLIATAWAKSVGAKIVSPSSGLLSILVLAGGGALGWAFWRPLYRVAEKNFWSLNALTIEPSYMICREALRHFSERRLSENAAASSRARLRAVAAAVAALLISGTAILVLLYVWPHTRWIGEVADLGRPKSLAFIAVANGVVLVCAYLIVAALAWAVADITLASPMDRQDFAAREPGLRTWRIAHLSDVHVVGGPYGFRIECGRAGPRGNDRFKKALASLEAIHAEKPLDAVLISGDMTDAGLASEWAEFLDAMAGAPNVAKITFMLPGNHDINIVDRANPARFALPTSPNIRLRKIRALSAIHFIQGARVHVIDRSSSRLGPTLTEVLLEHAGDMAAFSDTGGPRFSTAMTDLWSDVFPMVVPPSSEDGLGIVLLDTNADSHFSFTNALGLISAEQIRGIDIATRQFPRARWLIALHHHVIEYPRPAKVLSERVGTALVNGNAFLRRLMPMRQRVVLMHGHRHVDWIGECGGLTIVSAPSPVMGATDAQDTVYYVHTLQAEGDDGLVLLAPERITLSGRSASSDV